MSKEEWISCHLRDGGDKDVIEFIADIAYYAPDTEAVYSLFAAGYCYYFAAMLRIAFKRGTICHAYPFGHIVWVDENEIAYDIGGICKEYEELIPVDTYGKALNSFRHVQSDELLSVEEQRRIVDDIRNRTTISQYGLRSFTKL